MAERIQVRTDTSAIEMGLQQLMRLRIVLPNASDVSSYLNRHPDLVIGLLRVASGVRDAFAEDEQLVLQVYRDPEIADEYLTLYVRRREYPAGFHGRVREVSLQNLRHVCGSSGRLLVTTDFQPPA